MKAQRGEYGEAPVVTPPPVNDVPQAVLAPEQPATAGSMS
jgi:hypothetical protein